MFHDTQKLRKIVQVLTDLVGRFAPLLPLLKKMNNWKIKLQAYISQLQVKTTLNPQLFTNSCIIKTAFAQNHKESNEIQSEYCPDDA